MKQMLHIQKFITEHSDWEKLLSEKPYCLHITKDNFNGKNLVMFKYDQIESDMSLPIVQECRGLILDFDTNEIVSFPFKKFFNAGETNAAEIDWKSCWVGEKLDGSLIKMVRIGDEILISTNGTIDAFKAPLAEQIGCKSSTFGELVIEAIWNNDNFRPNHTHAVTSKGKWFEHPDYRYAMKKFKDLLEENNTYMFELTSPFNKVVVSWHETRLNFLGVRDNFTFQETYFSDHDLKNYFNTPKVFPLTSLDECKKATEAMGPDQEGFVVCDKNFNRIKVKSILYVSLAHMRNNGVLSYERGIEIVRGNELEEVLTYFPEFKDHLEKIKEKYDFLVSHLEASWDGFNTSVTALAPRKEAAIWITKNFDIPGVGFALLDGKVKSVKEWMEKCPAKNLVKWLGFKEQLT